MARAEQPASAATTSRGLAYSILVGGVLIVATASILITLAREAGATPLAIAAGRMTIAALLLTPLAWGRHRLELQRITQSDLGLALAGGAVLAIHFASWITSLSYTSVASSTALVTTNPVFVGLASALIFHERLPRSAWLGIGLSVAGSALIGLSDSGRPGSAPLLGDGLALIGAVAASGYFLIGRELRKRVEIVPYIWLVYSGAALVLLVWLTLAGERLVGLPSGVYGWLAALAIGPQLLGHTAFNWVIKHISATTVTVAILGEPVGSALLALVVLGNQQLKPLQVAGGIVLLAGIAAVTLGGELSATSRQPSADGAGEL